MRGLEATREPGKAARVFDGRPALLYVGEEFAATEDEYVAARADDVRDVAAQITAKLMGRRGTGLEALEGPAVILACSLAPSDTARPFGPFALHCL